MACPLGERKGRTRHRRVTTVSSTDIYIFLAPRSARRSDASNTAGRSAGGSLWRQREPGRKRRPRVQTPGGAAHAQPGWRRHLALRPASECDSCARVRPCVPCVSLVCRCVPAPRCLFTGTRIDTVQTPRILCVELELLRIPALAVKVSANHSFMRGHEDGEECRS